MNTELTKQQIDDIFKLSCEDRYDFFLDMVVDGGEVWILINENEEFLKIYSEEDELEYLPVWPHAQFASVYAEDSEEPLFPKSITLPVFFKRWITGLQRDNLTVGVFPDLQASVWITEPSELQSDLKEELMRAS